MDQTEQTNRSFEVRAHERAKALIDLMWHVGVFVIINGFLWLLDAYTDSQITWAFWVTISWGIGLVFHVLAWIIEGRDVENRVAERYLHKLENEQRAHERELT